MALPWEFGGNDWCLRVKLCFLATMSDLKWWYSKSHKGLWKVEGPCCPLWADSAVQPFVVIAFEVPLTACPHWEQKTWSPHISCFWVRLLWAGNSLSSSFACSWPQRRWGAIGRTWVWVCRSSKGKGEGGAWATGRRRECGKEKAKDTIMIFAWYELRCRQYFIKLSYLIW